MTTDHRTSSVLAVATAIAALLFASAGMAGASGPDGRVQGYVTEFGSGAPIPGAVVRVEASDLPWAFETTPDPTGYFAFAVPPHRYAISATSPLHLFATTAIAVGSGETTWANLTLATAGARSARFLGYVTDSVTAAPVTVGRVLAAPPWYMTSGYRNASSLNASGYYEMALVPGYYEAATEGTLGYDPLTYYSFSVNAGQVEWYNFTLDPNPVNAWINGTVRDADTSAPLAGATITVRVAGIQFPPVTSDGSGSYSIQVQSGTAEIVADAPGHAPTSTSTYVWGPGTTYLDLNLPPLSHSVRGYVTDGLTGAPLPGTLITVSPLWSDGYYDQATADASGYYEVAIPEDDFIVSARAPGYTTWSAYLFYFPSPVVWANATLWPIVSTVQGYLVDATNGSHIPGLLVNAIDLRTGYSALATADGTGFYSLGVPPSPAITIAVYGQGLYAGNIVYVGTRPYVTTWVNITLDRFAAQIQTTVTDAITGLPISGATVVAAWYYGSDSAATNATGFALLDAPVGGTTYLTALASGYLMWTGTITAAPGPNAVSIALYPDLPEDVRVRGYVNDSSGAAMWSATVEATGYDSSAPYDYTDSSGYYELWIVASPQTIRATESGYAAAEATVNPSPGQTIWVNLTLTQDSVAPRIRSFTATPSTGVGESTPAALLADVGEAHFERADLSILMLHSTSAGVGTFVILERLSAARVSISSPSPGNYTVSSSWDTRSPVGRLSDGVTSFYWPVVTGLGPFLGVVNGYWDNATLPSPVPAIAVFDTRDGRLLFVYTGSAFVGPQDQPASTFAPFAAGVRVDLSTAAIVGASFVTAPALRLGGLGLTLSPSVPSGQYGALLEAWDSAGGYAQAAVLMDTGPDTVPPVADAGPNLVVDEDTTVTFDGSASTDNLGIASYTWTFTDGSTQVLTGATATYLFATPGTYLVTLTVRDADGNTGTDTLTVTVRDVTDPTVSVSAPSEGATVSSSVVVTVTAADNVGVVRVEFFLDGLSVGNDTAAPFELTLPPAGLGVGNHTIQVVAYDAAGNSASDIRHVTVTSTPPGGGPGGAPDFLPWLVLLLIVAVAASVAVALILVRRRRPRAPVAAPPDPETPAPRAP